MTSITSLFLQAAGWLPSRPTTVYGFVYFAILALLAPYAAIAAFRHGYKMALGKGAVAPMTVIMGAFEGVCATACCWLYAWVWPISVPVSFIYLANK